MVIGISSQLGLRFKDNNVKVSFLTLMKENIEYKASHLNDQIKNCDEKIKVLEEEARKNGISMEELSNFTFKDEDGKIASGLQFVHNTITLRVGEINMIDELNEIGSKFYLITEGVLRPSNMIKINENFTGRALKNVPLGKHTYLLGKNEMCRFLCVVGAIKGYYYNDKDNIAFEFGFDLADGGFYYPSQYNNEFSKITKLMTFIELGDIEVVMLPEGRSNGKGKNDGKITNNSNYSVYVVDSTWNQILVRTDGFAVMGHFRLQPCGPAMADRKLIWISAFEKNGYTRRPKAEIRN